MSAEFSLPHETLRTWKQATGLPMTPEYEHARAMQEVKELTEEVVLYDGSPQAKLRVASEAVDVMIGMIGIVNAVGINPQELLDQKVETTVFRKYPADVLRAKRDKGSSPEQAMQECKGAWNIRWQKRLMQNNSHPQNPPVS